MARRLQLDAILFIAPIAMLTGTICGCNVPKNEETVASGVTVCDIDPAEFPPAKGLSSMVYTDSTPAPYRLTIVAGPSIRRDNLRFRVCVENVGPEKLGWDKTFVAGLSWRVQYGRSGALSEVEELVAPLEAQSASEDRLATIAVGESLTEQLVLNSLSTLRITAWGMAADRICIPFEEYTPFNLSSDTRAIRVQLRYRSGHVTWFRGGVKDGLARGQADSNAIEITWK